MKCEWCDTEMDMFSYAGGLRHCSHRCRNRHMQYAAVSMEAMLDGDDPPSKESFKVDVERARKWTLEKMQERIDEFKEP